MRFFFFSPFRLTSHLSLLTFFLLLCSPAVVFSQQRWERNYGGSGDDYGSSVQQTQDGGYIVVGYTTSFGNRTQAYLIKTDASGDTLWTRAYGDTGLDYGSSVHQTQDGGYIVAGRSYSYGSVSQVWLIKTNAFGDTLWTRTYGGTDWDGGYSVQQTRDGGYIVAGGTYSFGNGEQVYLIRTNASGDTLWTRAYGGTSNDQGNYIQQTTDTGYVATGYTWSFGNGVLVYLIKTNAIGDTLWTKIYGGVGYDYGYSVQQTSDTGYIIAGYTDSFGNGIQFYLIRTNATGDTLWTRTYGGTDTDQGFSVQQTSDGGYIVAGSTSSFGNSSQFYLIKTNASGDTLWTRTYGGTGVEGGFSVRQTSDGGYIVSGMTNSYGVGWQVYLVKTDANGNVGVEGSPSHQSPVTSYKVFPNPFTSFAVVHGHSSERFALYDVSGRRVGLYKGNRVGEGLSPGVYFLRPYTLHPTPYTRLLRLAKVR